MRTSLLASGALMLLALVPAGAQARIVSTPIKPAFQTNRLGAGTNATFHVDINTEDNANVLPSPGTHARVRLPKGIVINPKPFLRYAKGCTKANIDAHGPGVCSLRSKVGGGTSNVSAFLGGELVRERATVTAYGGPLEHGHPVLNLYVFAVSPISVQIVIKAILVKEPARSPYGYAFDADIPRIQTTPGNDDASIINFDVKVGAKTTVRVRRHGRTRKVTEYLSYVPRRCPAGGFRWGGDFAFESGETSSATATTPCPKG